MNVDQIDNELTASHVRMAQAFHDRMGLLIAGMFLIVFAVALGGTVYGWWRYRNGP